VDSNGSESAGFGGLCISVLEEIRDEYHSVYIPIFSFTDPFLEYGKDRNCCRVSKCNIPLMYSAASELATVIIPIDSSSVGHFSTRFLRTKTIPYHTSSVIAAVVESTLSPTYLNNIKVPLDRFDIMQSHSISSNSGELFSWYSDITRNDQLKFCTIESSFPTSYLDRFSPPISGIEDISHEALGLPTSEYGILVSTINFH